MTRCRSFLDITNKGQIKLYVFVMVADASFALRSSRLVTLRMRQLGLVFFVERNSCDVESDSAKRMYTLHARASAVPPLLAALPSDAASRPCHVSLKG